MVDLQVEERIPIEVCKTTRKDATQTTLQRGKVFRKEGEKRRNKIGKRRETEEQ